MTKKVSPPNLDDLRRLLAIPEINTGRRIYLFGHCASPVTDDVEGLHALADEQGRIHLLSGVEHAMELYRGQTQEYARCMPTLARLEKIEERFLALCRRLAFEDAIGEHPMVRLAEQVRFLDSPLFIDYEGLAQHYGLATDMLDVTSNFDVASFFATCTWSADQRRYQPVRSDSATGVMYRIPAFFMINPANPDQEDPLRIVGWQPLPRPAQQRALAVKLKSGQDFASLPMVETFRFRHQEHISHRIWNAFQQDDALFPSDAAAELADRAAFLATFTASQIERAWQRLMHWTGITYDTDVRKQIQISCGVTEIDKPCLSWDGLDIETSEERLMEQLNEVLNQVRYRMAAYL